jgi:hypothetical protein
LAGVLPPGVTGSYLRFLPPSAAAGQLIPLGFVTGTTQIPPTTTVTFGIGADPTVVSQIKVNDPLVVDNSWFLAFQTYHRHQIPPPDANLYAWDQYRNPDGTPKYPQREILTGPVGSAGPTGDSSGTLFGPGAIQSGLFHGKMIALASVMDDLAFPWSTDWHRQRAEAAQRGNLDKNFRLWYTDNADHGSPPANNPAAQAITVGYDGVVQQALRDVAAWAEQGIRPPDTTNYQMVETQPPLAASARKRGGVQPVVTLTADGAARADIKAGQTVSFTAVAEVPPGAGDIVAAEWDFLGLGTYPDPPAAISTPSPTVTLTATSNPYTTAGTYFPVVRVTSQRQGDPKAAYGRIQNLARARVVVT